MLLAIEFDNLHQILRSLYTEMMPLCGNMAGVAKGIAGQVGEQASGKLQTSDTLLCDGVRRALHEGILAACLSCLC